ncbi:MAG: leucyl aminopeptidase family protein, partial [Mycoplasmataceae bacterium]|nr:leucyl aminopeptidase family protein [Mycoplasmataceae bacterium]
MIKNTTISKTQFTLKAVYDEKTLNKDIIKNKNQITEFLSKREAVIYLGKKDKVTIETTKIVGSILANVKRDYQIKVSSFVTNKVSEEEIVTQFVEQHVLTNGDVFTMKTKKKEKKITINLLNLTTKGKKAFATSKVETEVRNWVRGFQVMPPNVLNSVNFAQQLKTEFITKHKNIKVKVLNKKQITELKMGLMLGVNAGSAFDPRVVVLEYKGNPSSKEKTTYVGKGIMFDSGGYSLKTGRHMSGMKYD